MTNNSIPPPPTEIIGEDIPKETLISLLKDKSKEIKSLSTKLSKIEEKYVKIFKEHKNLVKDKDVLERFLCKHIFSQSPHQLQPTTEFGLYEFEKLCELWSLKEEEKNQSMANIMSLINKEKAELEMKYKNLQERQSNEQIAIGQITSLKEQIVVYEDSNSKLTKEILELNDLLAKKNEEMLTYKKLEQEFSQYKAEILLKELNSKSTKTEMMDLKNRIKENEKTNEILRLKQELEQCHELIKRMETINTLSIKETVPEKKTSHQITQTDENVNTSFFMKKKSIEPLIMNKMMMPMEDSPMNSMNGSLSGLMPGGSEKINNEYLKNVILKFFVYLEGRNYNEAHILMQVILTIMKVSKEERKMIEDARDKASLWNSAKSFLSENLFFGQNREINYFISPNIKKNGMNGK